MADFQCGGLKLWIPLYIYICMTVYSRSNSLEPITRVELIHWAYKVSKLDCEIKASLWHGCNGSFIVLIKSFPLSAHRVSKEDSSSVHHSNQLLTESKAFAFTAGWKSHGSLLIRGDVILLIIFIHHHLHSLDTKSGVALAYRGLYFVFDPQYLAHCWTQQGL